MDCLLVSRPRLKALADSTTTMTTTTRRSGYGDLINNCKDLLLHSIDLLSPERALSYRNRACMVDCLKTEPPSSVFYALHLSHNTLLKVTATRSSIIFSPHPISLLIHFTQQLGMGFCADQIISNQGANRENGNFRTLSVLCQVEVVEVDAAASENAEIDPNLTWGE